MHSFRGGQLQFNYDVSQGRVLPSVEPLYEMKASSRSSIWKIREWFDTNADAYRLTLVEDTPTHITFALPREAGAQDMEVVESELYRERFDFSVDKHA
jgi:hypothetical protein